MEQEKSWFMPEKIILKHNYKKLYLITIGIIAGAGF